MIAEKLKDRVWSFSSISSFEQCPLSFKLKYLDKLPQLDNGFSDFGTLVHEVLEAYASEVITAEECVEVYKDAFNDTVTAPYPPYPPKMKERAYSKGLQYFKDFKGFGEGYKIVGVEKNVEVPLGPYKFRGIIDLILEHPLGDRIIVDHKTKSEASMRRDIETLKKQVNMYAYLHKHEYGKYPKKMGFNVIGVDKFMMFDFNLKENKEVVKWAIQTIDDIYNEVDFDGEYNSYFCSHICGVRDSCEHRRKFM